MVIHKGGDIMAKLTNLDAEAGASLYDDDSQPVLTIKGGAVNTPSLNVTRIVGNSSIGMMQFNVSGASVPVIELQGNSYVSLVSIVFAASANWAGTGGIRVLMSDGITYGWIP